MSDSTKEEQINNLVVNIDGPYGLPIQTSRYRNLLLIAGGIGITPIHAIYKYILQCTMGADRWSYAHIKKIRLLWVCRTVGDVAVMDESFREIQRYLASKSANNDMSGGPIFSFTIYVTGTESRRARGINIHAGITREKNPQSFTAAATAYISSAFQSTGSKNAELKLKHGRPDLQSEILSVSPWRMEGLVYVCGPQSLVQDTGKYAAESRVDFGYETFAL
jgi:ferredoxin-NADP reductase